MRVLVIANNGDVFAIDNADIMVTPSHHMVTGKDEVIIHGDTDVFPSITYPEVFLSWLKKGHGNDETTKIIIPTAQEKINELTDAEVNYILNDTCVIGDVVECIRSKLQPYEPLMEFLNIEVFPDKFELYLRVGAEQRRVVRPWPFNEDVFNEIIESVVKDDESGETVVRDQPNE